MGLPVHWRHDYSGWLLERCRRGEGAHVVTLNAEMAMQADHNPVLRNIILNADLVIPDGAGVVLYFRLKGHHIERTRELSWQPTCSSDCLPKNRSSFTVVPQEWPARRLFPGSVNWQGSI